MNLNLYAEKKKEVRCQVYIFCKFFKVHISVYRMKANHWFLGDRSGKRYSLQSGMMKFWNVMERSVILIVVILAQVYTYIKVEGIVYFKQVKFNTFQL